MKAIDVLENDIKNLNLEKVGLNELLIPYNAIIAIGDFVVVSEEDFI